MKTMVAILIATMVFAFQNSPAADSLPKPTFANVAYGPLPQHVLDFYQAESATPAPVLFFIHGGGWLNGDKSGFNGMAPYLRAGISVVSINYRFIPQAEEANLVPPVKGPLLDAARALQFVRSKSKEWNLDKQRIAATGSSAGSCSSLWLAFHPDLADPACSDPIARESTRLWCVAVVRAQTSLDPQQMKEWTPNNTYGAHAFGFKGDPSKKQNASEEWLSKRETILPWIAEYSPYALLTADDPPVYLAYDTAPDFGKRQENSAHTANFGVGLALKLKALGIEHELNYPGATGVKHVDVKAFLIEKLKASKAAGKPD